MHQRTPQQSCTERAGPYDRCKPVKYCRQRLADHLQRHLNFHHHSLTLYSTTLWQTRRYHQGQSLRDRTALTKVG